MDKYKKVRGAYRRSIQGFSFVEILIVIGFIVIIASIGMANFFGARNKQRLDLTTTEIVTQVRATMERARAQEDGERWGIRFTNSTSTQDYYEVWKGANYTSFPKTGRMQLGATIEFTDPSNGNFKDVVFKKATGILDCDANGNGFLDVGCGGNDTSGSMPSYATSTITIDSTIGAGSKIITVDTYGKVTY